MGRYYAGDIEGKMWFGVQDSTAPERFGCTECEPDHIDYFIDQESLPQVEKEIAEIESSIGAKNLKLLGDFFSAVDGYNPEIMARFHPNLPEIWSKHASNYADLQLGKQIRNHLQENSYCGFSVDI